jgi:hypothetical protein
MDSLTFKSFFNNALVHEDENYNCPFSCNFTGMKLIEKINIGVRFEKYAIQTMQNYFLEEPTAHLMSKLLQDNELFDQIERFDAMMDNLQAQSNINNKLRLEEWKKIDRIIDKYPEIQEVKTKTLARNYLNEELFQLLRLQRLRITVGFQAKMPIDTTLVTLDCNIGASNIVRDLKKMNSMSDVEMLQEGKTNLENQGVIENILMEFHQRIINRGRSTCKIL